MTDNHTAARALADILLSLRPSLATMEMFWGQVISAQTGPASLTITIGASSTQVPGVRYSASYTPTAGDTVYGRKVDTDYLVEGKLAQ